MDQLLVKESINIVVTITVNWTKVGTFSMQKILEAQTFAVTPTKGRYVKIKMTESFRDGYCSLSEVYVYGLE